MIFVVVSVLVVALVYSSSNTFYVYAVPPSPNWGHDKCLAGTDMEGGSVITCCWDAAGEPVENDDPSAFRCQACSPTAEGDWDCGNVHRTSLPTSDITPPQDGVLEQPPSPTPRTPGQSILPGEGVLEQPPTSTQPTPRTPGQSVTPGEGVLQQPPVDEATQPPSESLPDCPEGQALDEETGLCVLEEEEPEVQESEEEPEQTEAEENGGDN